MTPTSRPVPAVTAALICTALLGAAACSASTTGTPASSSASSSVPGTPGPTSSGRSRSVEAAPAGDAVPTPSDQERTQLVTILTAVNPRMTTDESVLIGKSLTVCRRMLSSAPSSQIRELTRTQFANGAWAPAPMEVQAIDMAITASFCR